MTVLDERQRWSLRSSLALGRLALNVAGPLEIFPVNFVAKQPTVLFKAAEGAKLFGAVANGQVVCEADDHGITEGWSVVVRGRARMLSTSVEVMKDERAPLLPWTATL